MNSRNAMPNPTITISGAGGCGLLLALVREP